MYVYIIYRWLLASADDTAVPFFVGYGFVRKITVPKRLYSKVLTTYDNALLVQVCVCVCVFVSWKRRFRE